MDIEISMQEAITALRSIGLPIPENVFGWIPVFLTVAILVAFTLKALWSLVRAIVVIIRLIRKFLERQFYTEDDKNFVHLRNNFIKHLQYEVERQNLEANWSDFYYTALEAEVELDPALDLIEHDAGRTRLWLAAISRTIQNIRRPPRPKIENDLVRAVMRSKSRAFLLIGDPGSGKTVSLRHLFLTLGAKSSRSRNKRATIPLYLNLKHMSISPTDVSAHTVHNWIVDQLQTRQNRTVCNFIQRNFDTLLANGDFFFVFDSFDEIPAVMDAYEEEAVVQQYAKALDDFLHAGHPCRGLLSSRPFRAPRIFLGQRMNIRPLSSKRVKIALDRYLSEHRQLARQVWHEVITERMDLMPLIHSPFYLALLANYIEASQCLPRRHYELFEDFVRHRAEEDKERLEAFVLTPDDLLAQVSRFAYAMTATPAIGTEVTLPQAQHLLPDCPPEQVQMLLDALTYSQFGKVSPGTFDRPPVFSFAHRRFQEYFAARFLREHPEIAPFDELAADNRWREVLVLLCEVLPSQRLDEILNTSRDVLTRATEAESGTPEHRQGIEALRFLRDAFRSRLEDLPQDIRLLSSELMKKQFRREVLRLEIDEHLEHHPQDIRGLVQLIAKRLPNDELHKKLVMEAPTTLSGVIEVIQSELDEETLLSFEYRWKLRARSNDTSKLNTLLSTLLPKENRLDQKRAVESLILADEESVGLLLSIALRSDSQWVQDTSLRSCRILTQPGEAIQRAIRRCIHARYANLSLVPNYSEYKLIFSYSAAYTPMLNYARVLYAATVVQFCTLLAISVIGLARSDRRITYLAILLPLTIWADPIPSGSGRTRSEEVFSFLGFWLSLPTLGVMSLPWITHQLVPTTSSPGHTITWPLWPIAGVFGLNLLLWYFAAEYKGSFRNWLLNPFISIPRAIMTACRWILQAPRNMSLRSCAFPLAGMAGLLGISLVSVFFLDPVRVECELSFRCAFQRFHPLVAIIYVLFSVLTYAAVLGIIVMVCTILWLWLVEQFELRLLALSANARPKSVPAAMEKLTTLRFESSKAEYVRTLHRWLPICADWEILLEEAENERGAVCDELYRLAEFWQDNTI